MSPEWFCQSNLTNSIVPSFLFFSKNMFLLEGRHSCCILGSYSIVTGPLPSQCMGLPIWITLFANFTTTAIFCELASLFCKLLYRITFSCKLSHTFFAICQPHVTQIQRKGRVASPKRMIFRKTEESQVTIKMF